MDQPIKPWQAWFYHLGLSGALLGLGIYEYPEIKGEPFAYYWVISLFLLSVASSGLLWILGKKFGDTKVAPMIYGLVQALTAAGGIGLMFFGYGQGKWKIFWPVLLGTVANTLLFVLLPLAKGFLKSLFQVVVVALSFALVLRLGGSGAGFSFGLIFLAGVAGSLAFVKDQQEEWLRVMAFGAGLALARALIQLYLEKSQYDTLGIVITHPYSFVALFLGIALPWVLAQSLAQDKVCIYETLIGGGIVLPLLLGIIFHVRPVAGFGLGLTIAAFLVGILQRGSLPLVWLGVLANAALVVGLPWFVEFANLTRVTRIYLILGVFVVGGIYLIIRSKFFNKNHAACCS